MGVHILGDIVLSLRIAVQLINRHSRGPSIPKSGWCLPIKMDTFRVLQNNACNIAKFSMKPGE
jgi:hypothetical protein